MILFYYFITISYYFLTYKLVLLCIFDFLFVVLFLFKDFYFALQCMCVQVFSIHARASRLLHQPHADATSTVGLMRLQNELQDHAAGNADRGQNRHVRDNMATTGVERTDSQRSQGNGPRVSFNRDVHVKRIGQFNFICV